MCDKQIDIEGDKELKFSLLCNTHSIQNLIKAETCVIKFCAIYLDVIPTSWLRLSSQFKFKTGTHSANIIVSIMIRYYISGIQECQKL